MVSVRARRRSGVDDALAWRDDRSRGTGNMGTDTTGRRRGSGPRPLGAAESRTSLEKVAQAGHARAAVLPAGPAARGAAASGAAAVRARPGHRDGHAGRRLRPARFRYARHASRLHYGSPGYGPPSAPGGYGRPARPTPRAAGPSPPYRPRRTRVRGAPGSGPRASAAMASPRLPAGLRLPGMPMAPRTTWAPRRMVLGILFLLSLLPSRHRLPRPRVSPP